MNVAKTVSQPIQPPSGTEYLPAVRMPGIEKLYHGWRITDLEKTGILDPEEHLLILPI